MDNFDIQVQRNLEGIELEKQGKIDDAIELYEKNINENFEGNHPYDRLAIIYSKRKQTDNEIRVLKKAILVFTNVVSDEREDKLPKLEKFKKRLKKISPEDVIEEVSKDTITDDDALKILKIRYVNGEISRDEYLEIKKDIGND